jgi:hypothetical protein
LLWLFLNMIIHFSSGQPEPTSFSLKVPAIPGVTGTCYHSLR